MEIWYPILEFSGYSVNNYGDVRNDRTDRMLTPSVTGGGHMSVGMVRDGKQYKRGVARLVLEHHAETPEPYFNTPIHLNGDLSNCQLTNLMWRPRWFANAFIRQFEETFRKYPPLRHTLNGRIYTNVWDIVMTRGLLVSHILRSADDNTSVFPTLDFFEWA